MGPRGVGKTALAKTQLKSITNVLAFNLLQGEIFRRFTSSPETFRKEVEYQIKRQKSLAVFVDEVQRVPALLNEVHFLIEEYKGKVQFLLTGSSARKLRREEANLLAGRARQLKLHPITFAETELPLEQALQYGQLPSVISDPDISYLESYVDVYLREEIYQESLIRKQEAFTRFLDVAAQYSGKLISFSNIARLSGTSDNTVKEYFQILVDTLLVHRIDAWHYSTIKRLNQQPRFYFFDTGVLNAACAEASSPVKLSSGRGGKLFEHLVILEMIRLNDYASARYQFFHYREREGAEIDVILHRNISQPPVAVEIKVEAIPRASELTTLCRFRKENPKTSCYCLTAGSNTIEENGIVICPWRDGLKKIFGI